MIKLMTLIKSSSEVAPEAFRDFWRNTFYSEFSSIPAVQKHLVKAVHNHVIPMNIREEADIPNEEWTGVSCYYFDSRVYAEQLLQSPQYCQLLKDHPAMMALTVNFLVDEVWIHNRDTSSLPVKAFAFFKRLPSFSRLEALQYYQEPHAELGDKLNKGRTVRYIQNHVLLDYQNPNPLYDYDGGPEIWFKSMEIALDLFGDQEAMEILGKDEETFVQRNELIHFLTDKDIIMKKDFAFN